MIKVLFLIHDLGQGGAEKVLVNLVNNIDLKKFEISVIALFGGGVNEQFLRPEIKYRSIFPRTVKGNSHIMKLFSPKMLHKLFIKDSYDIEISYLEGPSARIISGCPNPDTKLIYWIHCTMHSKKEFSRGFRSYTEAKMCMEKYHGNVFVSKEVMNAFGQFCNIVNGKVLYNTNESDEITIKADELVEERAFFNNKIKLIGVGKIESVKGFDRLARIHKKLIDEGLFVHTYILGEGSKKRELQDYLEIERISDSFTLLGYQTNPYKYIKTCDVFVCSSYSEGFSTAATEALIVGTPICTVEVSGMKEMLGNNNEYGIVTENNEQALYEGIRLLLDDPVTLSHYKEQATKRGKIFSTEATVKAVEEMLDNLIGDGL